MICGLNRLINSGKRILAAQRGRTSGWKIMARGYYWKSMLLVCWTVALTLYPVNSAAGFQFDSIGLSSDHMDFRIIGEHFAVDSSKLNQQHGFRHISVVDPLTSSIRRNLTSPVLRSLAFPVIKLVKNIIFRHGSEFDYVGKRKRFYRFNFNFQTLFNYPGTNDFFGDMQVLDSSIPISNSSTKIRLSETLCAYVGGMLDAIFVPNSAPHLAETRFKK